MTEEVEKKEYKTIFKTTFLFAFVRVFGIVLGFVRNKVVAVLLGAEGFGIIGLLGNSTSLIQRGAGLGISESAVRDISEAHNSNDYARFSRIISLTNKVIYATSFLGLAITLLMSPLLSKWTFGNSSYTLSYVFLSLSVGLSIFAESQYAILKGMRQMKALAKSGIIGSVVGFVTSVPLYFMFGKQGIVPSLIISAFSSVIFSNHFVRKVRYDKVKLSLREVISGSSSMVKMGIAIIFVSFMGTLFSLVVSAYIRHCGGLADVGLYQAGTAIVSGYFDIIISAMVTDYYPRICAVHKDNAKLQDALNKQSETGLIMLFPMVVIFAFFSSIILRILYSSEFIATNDYLDYAMLGTIIIFVSNSMDRILLAKQAAKVLLWTVIVLRIVFISIYLLLYKELNLFGLGLAYLATGVIHYAWMSAIMKRKYNIVLQRKNFCLLLLVLSVTMLAMFVRQIESFAIRYSIGITMIVVVSIFSVRYLDKNMNISIVGFVKSKFKRN